MKNEEFDDLKAQVGRITTVRGSIKALLEGYAAKLEDAKDDPAEVQAIANSLRTEADEFGTLVVAHTPAEPPA